MTYNWFLTNTTKTIRKNWNILQVIENLKEIFKNEPITAFKRNKNIQEVIGNRKWKSQKKKVNAHHAGQKLEMYVASKWKLQQHSRANKQTKLGRYFTVQTLRQYVILWSAWYATYSMSVKMRHHSTLYWAITGKTPKQY